MSWSGSKFYPLRQKWYRIREHENGDKDLLESDHQWAIEKGLGDDYDHSFNHSFKRGGYWFVQENIEYQFLFVEAQERVAYGYPIQPFDAGEPLDELFAHVQLLEEWLVYLEERLNDCELAMLSCEQSILQRRAEIAAYRQRLDGNYGQEICHHQARIVQSIQKLREFQTEHESLVAQLLSQEGREWRSVYSRIPSRWCSKTLDDF